MRPLVTGSAGDIGSVITTRLLEEGHHVTVIEVRSKGNRDAVPSGACFVQGRIHDAERFIDGARFQAEAHLAGFSLVGQSVEDHPNVSTIVEEAWRVVQERGT
jgi:UDP-glucose 4-epimerase